MVHHSSDFQVAPLKRSIIVLLMHLVAPLLPLTFPRQKILPLWCWKFCLFEADVIAVCVDEKPTRH